MSQERSCVNPFVKRIQNIFVKNGSFNDAWKEIESYQKRASGIYKVDTYFVHALAVSKFGLGTIVGYEYLRHQGVPLPDSLHVIDVIVPIKAFSEKKLFKELGEDLRHKIMEDPEQL